MNDPLTYSLNEVRHEIPMEVLELAFTPTYRHGNGSVYTNFSNVDIFSRIKTEIIDGRVREDIGLLGASHYAVPLRLCEIEILSEHEYMVYIPPSVTGGRYVTQFLGIYITQYDFGAITASPWPTSDQISSGARDLFKSHAMMPAIQSENGHIVGPNRIAIVDFTNVRPTGLIRVNLDSDEGMSHVSPGNYPRLANLVLLATKAYIYKTARVKLGRGAIEQGYDQGVIVDIINEYSDANDEYKEYLENTWFRASSFDNRHQSLRRRRLLQGRQ